MHFYVLKPHWDRGRTTCWRNCRPPLSTARNRYLGLSNNLSELRYYPKWPQFLLRCRRRSSRDIIFCIASCLQGLGILRKSPNNAVFKTNRLRPSAIRITFNSQNLLFLMRNTTSMFRRPADDRAPPPPLDNALDGFRNANASESPYLYSSVLPSSQRFLPKCPYAT